MDYLLNPEMQDKILTMNDNDICYLNSYIENFGENLVGTEKSNAMQMIDSLIDGLIKKR
jgi:hypothetical protein